MAEIHEQRRELAALLTHTENLIGDLEGAATVMENSQGLGKEARRAETILNETETL